MPQKLSVDGLDLSRIIRSGDTVMWGQACGEPETLTTALMAQRHAIGRMRCVLGSSYSKTLQPEQADVIEFVGIGGIGSLRRLTDAGVLDVLPAQISAMDRWVRDGSLSVDVVLVQVAPPNERGEYSLGVISDYIRPAVERARVVIAEVNDRVPRTICASPLTGAEIDFYIETSRAVVELPAASFGDVEIRIAERAQTYIPDGATLQMGYGTVPDAICAALAGYRHLGIHSGMIGDPIADLVISGAVTNERKEVDRGVSVTGAMMGTRKLYDLVSDNAAFRMESVPYTHGTLVLPRLRTFIAINSAIEVDLTGQVNAETVGRKFYGAVGGQVDYVRAANNSEGGCSILGLPSVTPKGKSRIVSQLSGPVTTARSDSAVIVTEHGVADLRGVPLKRRLKKMIELAAPDHRAVLERDAFELADAR